MCDVVDDGPSCWRSEWRRARKPHTCVGCVETIRPGDRYHYSSGIWDGDPDSFKHCARCWRVFQILQEESDFGAVDLELNCGEDYEGDNPEMYALAFMTADEAQALAASRTEVKP